jgi:hypothetical protein
MNIDELSRAIAQETGDADLTRTVRQIIDRSNEGRFLFRGSTRSTIPRLEERGVEPRSPEGGNVSYWTSGSRIFSTYTDTLNTLDTTFFHYLVNPMLLAITKQAEDEPFRQNDVTMLGSSVPYADLQLLVCSYPTGAQDARTKRQLGERAILPVMLDIVSGSYAPGTTRFVSTD